MYELSGQEVFADYIEKEIETIRSYDNIDVGRQLFFVYERTGEERYREAIEGLRKELKNHGRTKSGIFSRESGTADDFEIADLYQILPFYMEYETKYHNKAEYNDIVAQLQKVRKYSYEFSMRNMGWYLMVLIDVIGVMSEEIYEHYRTLGDLFKESLRGILPMKNAEPAMFGYAICKACRIGILNREKYADEGIKLVESFYKQMGDASTEEDMGIAMMAHAQSQMLKKEYEKEVHCLG